MQCFNKIIYILFGHGIWTTYIPLEPRRISLILLDGCINQLDFFFCETEHLIDFIICVLFINQPWNELLTVVMLVNGHHNVDKQREFIVENEMLPVLKF